MDMFLTHVSLLGSSTPERDLGVVVRQHDHHYDPGTVKYSKARSGFFTEHTIDHSLTEDDDMTPIDYSTLGTDLDAQLFESMCREVRRFDRLRYAAGDSYDPGDEALQPGDAGADDDPRVAMVFQSRKWKAMEDKIDRVLAAIEASTGEDQDEPQMGEGKMFPTSFDQGQAGVGEMPAPGMGGEDYPDEEGFDQEARIDHEGNPVKFSDSDQNMMNNRYLANMAFGEADAVQAAANANRNQQDWAGPLAGIARSSAQLWGGGSRKDDDDEDTEDYSRVRMSRRRAAETIAKMSRGEAARATEQLLQETTDPRLVTRVAGMRAQGEDERETLMYATTGSSFDDQYEPQDPQEASDYADARIKFQREGREGWVEAAEQAAHTQRLVRMARVRRYAGNALQQNLRGTVTDDGSYVPASGRGYTEKKYAGVTPNLAPAPNQPKDDTRYAALMVHYKRTENLSDEQAMARAREFLQGKC